MVLIAAASLRCSDNTGNSTAKTIEAVSGDNQSGSAGDPLANSLIVLVKDDAGNPVQGVEVQWAAQGGGSLSSATVKTGSDGRSSVQRTLGTTVGVQTTTATASGLDGSPVTFTSTATAGGGPGVTVTTQPPATVLSTEVFDPAAQPVVVVKDANGTVQSGVDVVASLASGSGTLEGVTTAKTNSSGVAAFTDLGVSGSGTVTLKFTAGSSEATSNSMTVSPLTGAATTGAWGAPVDWAIVPLHIHLLSTGKVLAWGKFEDNGTMGQPRLWDPSQGSPATATVVANDTMLFCAGHAMMADGKLMVSGGHKADDKGLDVTNIFDPVGQNWTPGLPKMAAGRWYPTVTELADGRMITVAGRDTVGLHGTVVLIPEIWENNSWAQLPGASLNLPYYPRDFVAPDGRVFYAGERVTSRWLDVDATSAGGRGSWVTGPSHIWPFNRDYGSAVMYDAGKILYVGGGGDLTWSTLDNKNATPTATAEKIDLNGAATWQSAGSMSVPRRHLNATVLPDGEVLVTGGVSNGGFNDLASAAHAAEIWNPRTNGWTTLASNSIARGYHSVSLLLPDGTVLHGGSGDADAPGSGGTPAPYPRQKNHEIFSPPYLFKGTRPTITDAPSDVGYNQPFTVTTPFAAQITDVRWIRLGSVTHAFDANGRAITLQFTKTAGALSVTAPANGNVAPPGYYMLFILNRNGVPSEGKFIHVQ
jgi:hypothetical protein